MLNRKSPDFSLVKYQIEGKKAPETRTSGSDCNSFATKYDEFSLSITILSTKSGDPCLFCKWPQFLHMDVNIDNLKSKSWYFFNFKSKVH